MKTANKDNLQRLVRALRFSAMSADAQETAVGMIKYCVDQGIGMGMDYGLKRDGKPRAFRRQLETFSTDESDVKDEQQNFAAIPDILKAVEDLRQAGLLAMHGTCCDYGEAVCCPAENGGVCECGYKDHNAEVERSVAALLSLLMPNGLDIH